MKFSISYEDIVRHALSEITSPLEALTTIILIIKDGIDVDIGNNYMLRWSAENGYYVSLRYLIEDRGANIDACMDEVCMLAAENGHADIVRYLCDNGANAHMLYICGLKTAYNSNHLHILLEK